MNKKFINNEDSLQEVALRLAYRLMDVEEELIAVQEQRDYAKGVITVVREQRDQAYEELRNREDACIKLEYKCEELVAAKQRVDAEYWRMAELRNAEASLYDLFQTKPLLSPDISTRKEPQ